MKVRKIFVMLVLAGLAGSPNAFTGCSAYSQTNSSPVLSANKEQKGLSVICEASYTISVPGDTRWIRLTAQTPQSVPHVQKIDRVEYSLTPVRYFDRNGYRYAEFMIYNPARIEKLEVTVHAELYRYDLETAMENSKDGVLAILNSIAAKKEKEAGLDQYLKAEKYIETNDPEIRAAAKSIKGSDDVEIVKNIYDYVLDHMDYVVQGKRDRGALSALRSKKGDCSEYSDLFVALCRARKIPARVVTGFSVQLDTKTAKHNWVEVYFPKYGWVPFDPSKGDTRSAAVKDRLFRVLEPRYIYYSHIRNDSVLDGYHYCAFTYFGDPVTVTDSVKFVFPPPAK